MSGTVGIICNENARYSLFAIALTQLSGPPNTTIDWSQTSDRAYGRNKLVERSLDRGSEWMLFLDDDHVFPTNILHRLLARDVDIVGSLYLMRNAPFRPVCYSSKEENGRYDFIDLTKHGKEDLVEVAAIGTGGMLIRSEVFHKMEFPWFHFEQGIASEDLNFCDKAREIGFKVHADLGCVMGHMTASSVWPDFAGEWNVQFRISDGFQVNVEIQNDPEDAKLDIWVP